MNGANSLRWILLAGALTFLACDRDKDTPQVQASPAPVTVPADTTLPALTLPPDSGPPPTFDGDRAMQYVKDYVDVDGAVGRAAQVGTGLKRG